MRGLGAADYDGDGRADIQVLTDSGSLNIHIGNTPTGAPATRWFARPDQGCDDPVLLVFDGSLLRRRGQHLRAPPSTASEPLGSPAGCNPPFNDAFCPDDPVTRGQMAAFLVRALGYTDDGGGNQFTDDNGSVFESAIDRLATAGVTLGCNPPANDRVLPRRAGDPWADGRLPRPGPRLHRRRRRQSIQRRQPSVFESAIDRLATAGVTLGCNPPGQRSSSAPTTR